MKRLITMAMTVIALVGCAPLAAVGSISDLASAVSSPVVDTAMVQATRRLINANDAYTVAATAVTAAATHGLIPASKAPQLRKLNADINTWLDRGFTALTAADRLRAVLAVEGLTAQLRALAGVN